jgi:general secretion pathway protein K
MRVPVASRGAALITALLVVAMATTIATALIWRLDMWMRQVDTQRDLIQARLLAVAGISWARAVLAYDARTSSYDSASEIWGTKVPMMPAEGGEVGGEMADEQGKWNLNNIWNGVGVNQGEVAVFQRLLQLLQLSPDLAITLADWIDGPKDATPDGAEDAYYLQLTPPYRCANRQLTDVDNLLKVRGFTADIVERLRPYVSALPGYNRVNVNTASAIVIAAELPGVSVAAATQIVANRDRIPFKDMSDFRNRLPNPEAVSGEDGARVDTGSSYFSVNIRARFGHADVTYAALLHRLQGDWPAVVWQKTL